MIIEKFIIDKLKSKLGIPVYGEVPKDIKYPFLVVSKTGGKDNNHIRNHGIIVQSYNTTLLKAAELSELVVDAMYEIEACDEICSISLDGNYPFNDSTNKRYRYQAVFQVYYYGG